MKWWTSYSSPITPSGYQSVENEFRIELKECSFVQNDNSVSSNHKNFLKTLEKGLSVDEEVCD